MINPIADLIRDIIGRAIERKSSDIHIEPFEDKILIRFRIDGRLEQFRELSPNLLAPIIASLKLAAQLRTDENRLPQDGKWQFQTADGKNFDIRLSLIPFLHGEGVVLRLLRADKSHATLADLGFNALEIGSEIGLALRDKSGLLLIAGPTGSGKSTSANAILQSFNDGSHKIITIEDPVEYESDEICQIDLSRNRSLTFASALRAILRQSPEVIFIGEIRDEITANLAINAALTGHRVLSTIHADDCFSVLDRLQNFGLDRHLIFEALKGILSQRLVRRLCPVCSEASSDCIHSTVGKTSIRLPVMKAVGCERCRQSGFFGRTVIYEWLRISRDLVAVLDPLSNGKTTASMAADRHSNFQPNQFLKPSFLDCIIAKSQAQIIPFDEALAAIQ